jgi:hypothetical protein
VTSDSSEAPTPPLPSVVIHKVIDGVEQLPSEYLNGGNYLYF